MGALEREIESIAERVFERKLAATKHFKTEKDSHDPEASQLQNKLAFIYAKTHISIGEAALVLNCSDGHIRNLIRKTRKRQTKRPIPFIDLDGVTVFNRVALLKWAEAPETPSQGTRTIEE